VLIIDSQVHLFGPEATNGRLTTSGHRPSTPDELLAEMDHAGVSGAVLVPPRLDVSATNDYAIGVALKHPSRFAVMGKLSLEDQDSKEAVGSWPTPGLFGFRVSFPPDQHLLRDDTYDWVWQEAESRAFPLMVWAPRQLGHLLRVAAEHPAARIAVDHCGLHPGDRDEQVGHVIEDLVRLAALENVVVKASGLPKHSSQAYPFTNLHQYLRQLRDAFGSERLFWGTDLTTLKCPYAQAVSMFTEELDFLTTSEICNIMGQSLARWLNWSQAGGQVATKGP
jgi:L-fuconolactonase